MLGLLLYCTVLNSSTTLQILHSPLQISPCRTPVQYSLFLFLPTLPLGRPANFQKRGLVWRETSFGPTNSNFQPKANCSVLKASSAASLLYLLHMSFIVYFHSCLSRCHVDRHEPNLAIRYYFSRFGSPGTECTRFPHGYPLCGGKRGLRHLSINFLVCTPSIRRVESNHQQPGGFARGGQFRMMVEKADHISYVSPIAARQCILFPSSTYWKDTSLMPWKEHIIVR